MIKWGHGHKGAKGGFMALTDTRLRTLKTGSKAYQVADEGGLFVEVMPGGAEVWRMLYRSRNNCKICRGTSAFTNA